MPFTTLRETPRELTPTAAEQVAEKRVREYETKLTAMEKSVLTLKDVILALGKEQSEKERALVELRDAVTSVEEHIDSLDHDREQALKKLQEIRNETILAQNKLAETYDDIDNVNNLVHVAKEKLNAIEIDAQKVIAEEQVSVQESQEAVSRAKGQLEMLVDDIVALDKRLIAGDVLEKRIPVLQEQLTTLEKKIEKANALLEVTGNEQKEAWTLKEAAVAEANQARQEIETARATSSNEFNERQRIAADREHEIELREQSVSAREVRLSAKIDELKLKFPTDMAKLAL
jgi:chromosome segregation ATPase